MRGKPPATLRVRRVPESNPRALSSRDITWKLARAGRRVGSLTGAPEVRGRQPSANRAAKILRIANTNPGRSDHALGAFYRKLAARTEKSEAITATARKLAILVYRVLEYQMPYHETSAAE